MGKSTQPQVTLDGGVLQDVPARGCARSRRMQVRMPRTWMNPVDVLVAAHRQTGLAYAIVPAVFRGPVGPFDLGAACTVEDLVGRVAEATGTRAVWTKDVAVFLVPATTGAKAGIPDSPRAEVSMLDAQGDIEAVVRLTQLAGHEDGAVRLYALAALQRMEGDFVRGTYPGRLSILEVLADRIDREALLFALEEGGPAGGRVWKLAAELLGRARTRILCRYLWYQLYQKRAGTTEMALWSLGRCGDPSGGWAIRPRMRESLTNDPSHRYLAAMALGQLDATADLLRDREDPNVDARRAIAFGLGFCRPTNEAAQKELVRFLEDADPSVRFVACQSLARLGGTGVAGLKALAGEAKAGPALRAAALAALVTFGRPEASAAVLGACADPDPGVRAQAAELGGDIVDPRIHTELARLAGDADRSVRCAAVLSLARISTPDGIAAAAAVLTDGKANGDERIASLLGLGRSLSPAAAEPLARIAHDTTVDRRLREYAILGLAQLAHRSGQERLVELADWTSPRYVSLAARHLELETPQATAEFLLPYLTHADREGACAAAGRLAELGYGPGVVELLEGSDVFDNHTRMMHMWGAVRATGREVTLAVAAASGSRRGSVRYAAAFALGDRLYPEAVDALLRLTQDAQGHVRAMAAQVLGTAPDPRVVPALIDLALKDENQRVAIEAVRSLRGRDFRDLPAVKAALKSLVGTPRDAGGIDPDAPSVAEQPDNTFVLRTWAEHTEEDLVSNLTYESSLCYDAHRGRIVMWGAHGRRYDTPQTSLTWVYDAGANQWTRLVTSRDAPLGTCGVRGTMYDRSNRLVVSPRSGGSGSHGWHNALRANLMHGSPWVLDTTTDQWYAARPAAVWGGGYMPSGHDPVHGVNLWWRDGLVVYDAYANRWAHLQPEGPAPESGDTGGAFDPQTGRFIAVGARSTWAYDPTRNAWTDLKPSGPHPAAGPMVYDAAHDVMIQFQVVGDEVGVWVYHVRENRWERLPAAHPCPARGKIWDAVYDEQHNVTVIGGTHPHVGTTASFNCRETWTYRYKRSAVGEQRSALSVGPPTDVQCVTAADGRVMVTWKPAPSAVKYLIERGAADEPWRVRWEQAGVVDGSATAFEDTPKQRTLMFYHVIAVGPGGAASRPSLPARTVPRMLLQVTAVVRTAGGVVVRWTPSSATDVIGYNLYRCAVDLAPWTKRFSPEEVAERFVCITEKPARGPEFVDAGASVVGPADELTYPKTYVYVVRPVNAWGLEGGPSPVTLALPDVSVPWADGRRLVLWSTCLCGEVTAFHLMRMDDWLNRHVYRLTAAPLLSPAFWDAEEFPTGDRRRYFSSGVDALGTIGIPTSGGWSHGFP
jgi:HEAT repeat protein